jgi:hypothetical protein
MKHPPLREGWENYTVKVGTEPVTVFKRHDVPFFPELRTYQGLMRPEHWDSGYLIRMTSGGTIFGRCDGMGASIPRNSSVDSLQVQIASLHRNTVTGYNVDPGGPVLSYNVIQVAWTPRTQNEAVREDSYPVSEGWTEETVFLEVLRECVKRDLLVHYTGG